MNMTKVAPIEKCNTCFCGQCSASEIGKMYALNSALDHAYSILGVGLVFFDNEINLTHLNDLAKSKLNISDEFILTGGDVINECFSKKSQAELKVSINQLIYTDTANEIRHHASIKGEDNVVMLQRLEKTAFGISAPGVAMFIFESKRDNDSSSAEVARIFGLTKTEARLTLAIVNGMTAAEYSEKYGISINTAYSQIKEVLAKTGARRQAELVKLVLEHSPSIERRKNIVPIVTDRRNQ